MKSHLKLDGIPYNIQSYRRQAANPMAAKLGQGTTQYGDQQNWDYFVQESWQNGQGKYAEDAGGAWFIVGDVRAGKLRMNYSPVLYSGLAVTQYCRRGGTSFTVGPTGTYEKVSRHATEDPTSTGLLAVQFFCETPSDDTVIDWYIYESTTGSDQTPSGGVLKQGTYTVSASLRPGLVAHAFRIVLSPVVGSSDTCIVFEPRLNLTFSATTGLGTTDDAYTKVYNGSSWVTMTGVSPSIHVEKWGSANHLPELFLVDGNNPGWVSEVGNFARLGSSGSWEGTGAITDCSPSNATPTSVVVNDTVAYVGFNNGDYMWKQYLTTTGHGHLGVYAKAIAIGGGYLWRAYGSSVFYSSDELLWTEIDCIHNVQAIEFYDESLYYLGKNHTLGKIGYGDVSMPVVQNIPVTSTSAMKEIQGLLYIYGTTALHEFDGSSYRNISPMQGGTKPEYVGSVTALAGGQSTLYCGVSALETGGRSAIYARTGDGWILVFDMGGAIEIRDLTVMSAGNGLPGQEAIRIATNLGVFLATTETLPEVFYTNTTSYDNGFLQPLWVESPWIYGGTRILSKDWESITFSSSRYAETVGCYFDWTMYYMQEGDSSWTELASGQMYDEDVTIESRFPLSARPDGLRLRYGLLMSPIETGRNLFAQSVDAVVIKYHAMLRDRWQWSINIPVSAQQTLGDGSQSPFSVREQEEALDGLLRKQGPFLFVDLDGEEYEVKVSSGAAQPMEIKWDRLADEPEYNMMYTITLDQVA